MVEQVIDSGGANRLAAERAALIRRLNKQK